uniref:Uncharacterized protein n=1 Tax=Kalanchoe fedtschenkoi TaxID=63787 RepID=A0A7N0V720_KALFE
MASPRITLIPFLLHLTVTAGDYRLEKRSIDKLGAKWAVGDCCWWLGYG